MDVGLAARVTVGIGTGFTVTVAEAGASCAPLAPTQVSVYVVVAAGETESVPLVATTPAHPPEAIQAVAPVVDQVRIEPFPAMTVAGLALSTTGGGGPVTVTVADA